jgi:hypothetical protein
MIKLHTDCILQMDLGFFWKEPGCQSYITEICRITPRIRVSVVKMKMASINEN